MEYTSPLSASILECLRQLFPESSSSTLRAWLKEGRFSIDGYVIKRSDHPIQQGTKILFGPRKIFVGAKFPIIYSDSDILIIDKPAGLLSVSTNFEKKETVFSYLKEKFHPKTVYVVHRLDQDTSGVMVFALSEKAFKILKKKFATHDIVRRYTAIVEGELAGKGTWDSYLYEDENYVVRLAHDRDQGEHAITHYSSKKSRKNMTWVELTLETGKKNQIRVQSLHAGHPIVGDKKYGAADERVRRLCLHAHLLEFEHPVTGKYLSFESAVPREFYRLIDPRKK